MISKRELSGRRDLKTIAVVFDIVKCQRDKALDCLSWYWFCEEAIELMEDFYNLPYEAREKRKPAIAEIEETALHAAGYRDALSEEIRKEMEGQK